MCHRRQDDQSVFLERTLNPVKGPAGLLFLQRVWKAPLRVRVGRRPDPDEKAHRADPSRFAEATVLVSVLDLSVHESGK